MPELRTEQQYSYNPDLAADYDELLASLHLVDTYAHNPEDVQVMCQSQTSNLYLGFLDEKAATMATLIKPVDSMGHRTAILEDVAVQRSYRGLGFGTVIVEFLLDQAKVLGSSRVELHSRDIRQDAHALYKKMGFKIIETNLFRIDL